MIQLLSHLDFYSTLSISVVVTDNLHCPLYCYQEIASIVCVFFSIVFSLLGNESFIKIFAICICKNIVVLHHSCNFCEHIFKFFAYFLCNSDDLKSKHSKKIKKLSWNIIICLCKHIKQYHRHLLSNSLFSFRRKAEVLIAAISRCFNSLLLFLSAFIKNKTNSLRMI